MKSNKENFVLKSSSKKFGCSNPDSVQKYTKCLSFEKHLKWTEGEQ